MRIFLLPRDAGGKKKKKKKKKSAVAVIVVSLYRDQYRLKHPKFTVSQ